MRGMLLVSAFLGSSAFADAGLIGTWKLEKLSCTSGVDQPGFGEHVDGGLEATAVISESKIATTFNIKMKYKADFAEATLKQLGEAIAATEKYAESAEKTKSLEELNASLAAIQKYARGVACTTKENLSYTVTGDVIRTHSTNERSSDCPGDASTNEDDTDGSKFELNGDTLKVTDITLATDDGQCPKGDHNVTTFSRVK